MGSRPASNGVHFAQSLVFEMYFVNHCLYICVLFLLSIILFLLVNLSSCLFTMLSMELNWIEFWCLMPLSAIFQLYHGDQISGGRNRSTRRELPTIVRRIVQKITVFGMWMNHSWISILNLFGTCIKVDASSTDNIGARVAQWDR
jgi:hypothetical protein